MRAARAARHRPARPVEAASPRASTWGLTGTPLLSSEARITELASLCGGTYITGAASHWRTMERASVRDVFLRYHESASSLTYQEQRAREAQAFINAAVQRNRVNDELAYINRTYSTVLCKLERGSAYELLLRGKGVLPNFSPPFAEKSAGKTTVIPR